MKLDILNKEGKSTGNQITLNDAVFGIEPNKHVVYLNVKQYLANQRQGTHETLERSTVSGSTKKLHKQKGTGGSRKGSVKSLMFPGGPRAFGPHPRDYGFKLNAKTKELARRSVLSAKAQSNSIFVVEDFDLDSAKTKSFISFLGNFNLTNKKTMMVTGEIKKNLVLSARNVQKASISTADNINTYTLINADTLILSVSAVNKINESLNK
jgi:large subunit ribosomal protein L4